MLSKKALGISPSPTMAIDSKAKELRSRGVDVIGFGAGEPDFDTPEHVCEAAIRAIQEGHTRYTPAAGTVELKEAICEKLKNDNGLDYSPAQIVVSNGAKHSLQNILAALLNPGDEVMIPAPYWVSYPEMVRLNDGVPVTVEGSEGNRLKVNRADLERACSSRCKALILNSPSNPTGLVYDGQELKSIASFCRDRKIFIIADEIYEKLIYGENRHLSVAAFGEEEKALTIVVNGVSKSHAMTGWRIGYTASTPEIAAVMANIQSHTASNPNSIAQKAAVAALRGPQDCVEEMRLAFDERRRYIYERVVNIPGFDAVEPAGAFYIFADMSGLAGRSRGGSMINSSDDFAALLLEQSRVALVPGTGFGAPHHVRLSFATSMENIAEGMDRIEAFVGSLD